MESAQSPPPLAQLDSTLRTESVSMDQHASQDTPTTLLLDSASRPPLLAHPTSSLSMEFALTLPHQPARLVTLSTTPLDSASRPPPLAQPDSTLRTESALLDQLARLDSPTTLPLDSVSRPPLHAQPDRSRMLMTTVSTQLHHSAQQDQVSSMEFA